MAGLECITTMTTAGDAVYTCTQVSDGDEGASCDELTKRACDLTSHCRLNECPSSFGPAGAGICPAVSADGEACTGAFNCDAFSDCLDGVCTIRDRMVCR